MFTGIITAVSRVKKIQKDKKGGWLLTISKPRGWRVKMGTSINVNGVCSTVTVRAGGLAFTYMPETAERSSISSLVVGEMVNLEQSLRLSDRLDGHIVQGHVDTIGIITSIITEGNSFILRITVRDKKIMPLIAEKGSVTIDGISLTVTGVVKDCFTVKIIPHSWRETNLKTKKKGDTVNVETDMMAKYLQRLLPEYATRK